jgi:hypothetical protein
MKYFKPNDFIVARWLAIAGAAGAAVAQAIAYYTTNSYWNTVAFVAALLSAAAVAGLWRAITTRNTALVEAVQESDDQQRVMKQLHRHAFERHHPDARPADDVQTGAGPAGFPAYGLHLVAADVAHRR